MASLSLAREDFDQPKANVEWTVAVNVGMKAQDESCRAIAGYERKAGEHKNRQDQKDWEIGMPAGGGKKDSIPILGSYRSVSFCENNT
jgi:hypothetical protein